MKYAGNLWVLAPTQAGDLFNSLLPSNPPGKPVKLQAITRTCETTHAVSERLFRAFTRGSPWML